VKCQHATWLARVLFYLFFLKNTCRKIPLIF
jgi:hypothetical protein